LIGVLVSGEGTNLQALIDEGLPIAGVISSKPGVPALDRAENAGIATAVYSASIGETTTSTIPAPMIIITLCAP